MNDSERTETKWPGAVELILEHGVGAPAQPGPIFSSPQEILKDFPAEPPQTEPLDLAAQGTPEPPKVEELQAIAEKWAVDTDREIDPHAFAEFAKFVLRPYFPSASQKEEIQTAKNELLERFASVFDSVSMPEMAAEIRSEIVATPASTARTDATRFKEFDDADHPCNKWWQEHGHLMMSGGGRREFIWACRGWIAREQLAEGVEVTGESMHETPPAAPGSVPQAQEGETT